MIEFDPYAQWLQIPADRRPPTYYDLLGLPAFESDAARIRTCALERTNHVRRYQLGQYSQAAIQLLNELSRAFDTLTTPERKQKYDRRLAGMATEDGNTASDTVVVAAIEPPPVQATLVAEPAPPPVQVPASPFQVGYTPPPPTETLAETPAPRRRIGASLAAGLRRSPAAMLRAGVVSLVLSAKAALWSVRLADRAMCKSLGDENAILHNFFRVVIIGAVLASLAALPWLWPRDWTWSKLAGVPRTASIAEAPHEPMLVESLPEDATPEAAQASTTEVPVVVIGGGNSPSPSITTTPAGSSSPSPPVVGEPIGASAVIQNSVGMLLVYLPPGKFEMGSPATEAGRIGTEQLHTVHLSRGFRLGIHEVTTAQYEAVMGARPKGPQVSGTAADAGRLPIGNVLWSEAVEFCRRLSDRAEERVAGRLYRLPTEAEWEYACRAGTSTPYNSGAQLSTRDASFLASGLTPSVARSMAVGSGKPNRWNLFDMHGNLEEWCSDYYDYGYYRNSPVFDPPGPTSGVNRVARGGSYLDMMEECRSARRVGRYPGSRSIVTGFRVAIGGPP